MESEGNSTIQTLGYKDVNSQYTAGYFPYMFDGTPADTSGYSAAHITCHADASGIIRIMQSMDNSIWDLTEEVPYTSGSVMHIKKDIKGKWFKAQFEHLNETLDAECNLRLQTIFHNDSAVTNVNIVGMDLPYITVSGGGSGGGSGSAPISHVWESDEVTDTSLVVSNPLIVYTIHCMNFAPDYRFVKLYDKAGSVDLTDRPKLTLPVVADVPYHMQFPNGLQFTNSLQVKATRGIRYDDVNLATSGDVHLIVTYDA